MEKNFNLSDKIQELPLGLKCACGKCDLRKIFVDDVKEFIRLLKEKIIKEEFRLQEEYGISSTLHKVLPMIDELAGEELI